MIEGAAGPAPVAGRLRAAAIASSLALAILVRAPVLTEHRFPINDGALFHEMIAAVRAGGYRLPASLAWNGEALPFAYPPLSFYVAAVGADATGADPLVLLRILPLLFNLATVAAGVLLVARLARGPAFLGAAVLLALEPHGFEWLVMGGGIARSLGFLLAVLAWVQALRYGERPGAGRLMLGAVLVASAGATHLEWGIDAAAGFALFVLARRPDRRGAAAVLGAGAIALLAASPWWATVLVRHGMAPFSAAARASHWSLSQGVSDLLLLRPFSHEYFITYYLGLPALAGSLARLARRSYLLPLWHLQFFFLTPRHAREPATIPVAILAAEGVIAVAEVLGGRLRAAKLLASVPRLRLFLLAMGHRHLLFGVVAILCGLMAMSAWMRTGTPLRSLSHDDLAAMRHLRDHAPPDARFVVLSTAERWADDRHAEWFPVVARRRSLATIQGVEWLPGAAYWRRVEEVEGLRRAQRGSAAELAAYLARTYPQHDHVAVFGAATAPDAARGGYAEVPTPGGVRVLRRPTGPEARTPTRP